MAEESSYIVTSERSNAFSPLSSLSTLWKFRANKQQIISAYDRPPYPILVEAPTLGQLISSWRFCDYFALGTTYTASVFTAFYLSRQMPNMFQRTIVFHGISHGGLVTFATLFLLMIPHQRLTGFYDNGLRWRKPENKLKKYDSTSRFENETFWGKMVFRNNEQS
eukprot:NODE_5727_length_555_cov_80.671937_g4989_i0.p1 GENE.NODE_5727_length_555_cov_80.671937_g4989_i0~~NODE_5727_length_555_cov_80.671937_g4989_i0.p1  ORF type:complete len:165 (+),score=12.26 NODE_5727_length_555_cov_80.671937_g4989_i0:39-533(+)